MVAARSRFAVQVFSARVSALVDQLHPFLRGVLDQGEGRGGLRERGRSGQGRLERLVRFPAPQIEPGGVVDPGQPGFGQAGELPALLSPELYLLLVSDRQWSPADWESWTYQTLLPQLCEA
jgi:hypothetical protein